VAYSTTTADTNTAPLAGNRSQNGSAGLTLSTQFGPKTGGSAGVSYSRSRFPGDINTGTSSALNVFATVSHTF
jgi:hypothetical protein